MASRSLERQRTVSTDPEWRVDRLGWLAWRITLPLDLRTERSRSEFSSAIVGEYLSRDAAPRSVAARHPGRHGSRW